MALDRQRSRLHVVTSIQSQNSGPTRVLFTKTVKLSKVKWPIADDVGKHLGQDRGRGRGGAIVLLPPIDHISIGTLLCSLPTGNRQI